MRGRQRNRRGRGHRHGLTRLLLLLAELLLLVLLLLPAVVPDLSQLRDLIEDTKPSTISRISLVRSGPSERVIDSSRPFF